MIIKARRLVVVSGGALGSPLILERSGIGSPNVLQSASIPLLVDLPGVGENYQGKIIIMLTPVAFIKVMTDHPGIIMPYKIDGSVETYDGLYRDDPNEWKRWSAQWTADGSGLLGTKWVPLAFSKCSIGLKQNLQWCGWRN